MIRATASAQFVAIMGGFAIILVLAGVIMLVINPVDTTFNVTAETERVEMRLLEPPPSRWVLESVDLIDNYDPGTEFSGSIELGAPLWVIIERVAFGDLWVHVECRPAAAAGWDDVGDGSGGVGPASTCDSAGTMYSPEEERVGALGPVFDLLVTDLRERAEGGRSVLLALHGHVVAGRTIGIETAGTTAMLRSGRVSMLGRSVFQSTVFEGGGVQLDAGDRFEVIDETESPALGFVRADERPGLTAAYRVVGKRGTVTRAGGGSYTVSASLLGRFLGDPVFRAIAGLLALAAAVATIGTFVVDTVGPSVEAMVRPASAEVPDRYADEVDESGELTGIEPAVPSRPGWENARLRSTPPEVPE